MDNDQFPMTNFQSTLRRNAQRLIGLFLISYFLFLAVPAQAALVPCSGLDCTLDSLVTLGVNIYNYLLGMGALVALFFIILGGVKMFYYGIVDASESNFAKAKSTVVHAVVGLILLAAAYLIVNTLIFVLSGGTLSIKALLEKVNFGGVAP